jgi:poly(beta-D-mannuronate) lyase
MQSYTKKHTSVSVQKGASKLLTLSLAGFLFACQQTSLQDETRSLINEIKNSTSVTAPLGPNSVLVSTPKEYQEALSNIAPGQTIVLANGTYTDFEILLSGEGTASKPIKLTAQTEGKVILTGLSNIALQGKYLEVSGLVFKDGFSPTGSVISFRGKKGNYAYHSRVTRTVIDSFSNPDKFNSDTWVNLYGKHNRFDHNHLIGKTNKGVTLAVRLTSTESQQNYHQIDHNYFGPRQILGSNGGETLRIGTSTYSLTNSLTTVENNYFDRTNGEVEIISNKSGKNIFRNNVFFEARGTLTLRHGNGNLVEGNYFFGNGVDHTGGIRVINADQTIRNNYMEGLPGIRFGGGLVVLNGVPNSRINRYHQVNNATIENNTLVGVSNINLAAASDAERSAVPINSSFKRNLVINESEQPFKVFDDISGIAFTDNLINVPVLGLISDGFEQKDLIATRNSSGVLSSEYAHSKNIGMDPSIKPIEKEMTGVSWYPKVDPFIAFSSNNTVVVNSPAALKTALASAKSGDRIELSPGEYELTKQLLVDKVITISGQTDDSVTLLPMRSVMAEIAEGGSLRLETLTIDGKKAPDSAGNVLVRHVRVPTKLNNRLEISGVKVLNLNVNHSAHVFDAGYHSLADNILIENSHFENITGDILRLDKEVDDLGIYNAEYVTITNTTFSNIEGAIAKIYRGGTDESTFGPHLLFANNKVNNVGGGKRNKSQSSLFLHGVQDTDLLNNEFTNTKPVIIEHAVGEPQTLIKDNHFGNVGLPVVTEIFTKGESTAVLKNNTVH